MDSDTLGQHPSKNDANISWDETLRLHKQFCQVVLAGSTAPFTPWPETCKPRCLMGLFSGYWSSLKPLDVEEPIDVYVHRPLGFLVAKLSYPTFISPNLLTLVSIFFGVASGISYVWVFPWHMQVGALLTFLSAVVDCSDGQLARMRKSSSAFGRMLDGVADLITTSFIVPGTLVALWRIYDTPVWLGVTVSVIAVATIVTSSFHTGMYDHYKNMFLYFTDGTHGSEGEGADQAEARLKGVSKEELSWWKKGAWRVYLFYLRSQADYVHKFDPFTTHDFGRLPGFSEERAAIYRSHNGRVMRVWRSWFGFGTMIFGLALFNALERPDIYLAIRLIVLNGLFYLWLRPMQRKASRDSFSAMGLDLHVSEGESETGSAVDDLD